MTDRKLLIERSAEGKQSLVLPKTDVPEKAIEKIVPAHHLRTSPCALPEVAEPELVRHYVNLSTLNHHVDKDFYPLGSCTMKYNPKINEAFAASPCISEVHPLQPDANIQASLKIYHDVERFLCEITGMDAFTLQPAAGSHGELTGVMIMRQYHEHQKNHKTRILIPDSAHGTNPSSVNIGGYQAVTVASTPEGLVDLDDLRAKLDDDVAGFMLTNPNTLGIFEKNVLQIAELIHSVDGLMYMDGANMNALLGIVKTADMHFDITHINLHKTFSTPHGGGGPGAGPIGVVKKLVPYLPVPRVIKDKDNYHLSWEHPESIGKVMAFWGNYSVIVKTWVYIRMLGEAGLKDVAKHAIINANYIRASLEDIYELPYKTPPMHECVFSGDRQKSRGVRALDIAKRLLDYGMHAPTVYFPLIVHEALMIEPTETENKASLDHFIAVMRKIDEESREHPELLTSAPQNTPVRRIDELKANRDLNVRW
ncbi:MAG: aminomethyl-transferring glycine dehydrogenase subunit GcvPB [Candidatus Marinimicrobia bacterium]|jgi:glycine dehydrogenase subunit 2|nr:aminomethyl-transferring glycine dehydrogenase subunit GcvPB [Candidatus Neomarinimicrobiota bacterium]MDD5709391.1 aminomethyl-transferring glycine dehydrogenase subunit GcvPB [Candidatus Neomarinimicrobiota bacterium]MDX9777239.1 aminomethyl-transferring glycine dehydrogenase subunit GcvPB [bacterium]